MIFSRRHSLQTVRVRGKNFVVISSRSCHVMVLQRSQCISNGEPCPELGLPCQYKPAFLVALAAASIWSSSFRLLLDQTRLPFGDRTSALATSPSAASSPAPVTYAIAAPWSEKNF